MATIALRFPSVNAAGEVIPGGHAYLIFPEPAITVRELLQEKVRAEFRKGRAGGVHMTSLPALFGYQYTIQGPLDEQLRCAQILRMFESGEVVLLVDGKMMTDLDHVVFLSRRTGLALVVPSVQPKEQHLDNEISKV